MLDHVDLDGLLLAITHLDLEALRSQAIGTVLGIVRHAMLANQVEAVTREHADDFVLRRVVDAVLADKLELAVAVLGVEADLTLRQGHTELIDLGVLELAVDLHLTGRIGALAVLVGTIKDIETLSLHARRAHELDLLGLLVAQGRGITQRVEVEFVE